MESCPSWSKEHDWKSCKRPKPFRGFESLALRQKKKVVPPGCYFSFFINFNQGIRTRNGSELGAWRRKERQRNSPVDCFDISPTERSEGEKISCSPPKKESGPPRVLLFFFLFFKGFEPEMGANSELFFYSSANQLQRIIFFITLLRYIDKI